MAAVALLPGNGGHLPLCRTQPAADLVRYCGVGLVVDRTNHFESFVAAVQIEQDVSLLACGERQEGRVACFPRSGGGALEVIPRGGEASHIDGLPSGEGGSVGQDGGELTSVAWAQGVAQAGLDLADVGL